MEKKTTVQTELAEQGKVQDASKARAVALVMALVGLVAPWIFRGQAPDPTLLEDWFVSLVSFLLNGGIGLAVAYYKSNFVKPLIVVMALLPIGACAQTPSSDFLRAKLYLTALAAVQGYSAFGTTVQEKVRVAAACNSIDMLVEVYQFNPPPEVVQVVCFEVRHELDRLGIELEQGA